MKFNEIYEGLLQGKKYRLSYWEKNEYIYYHRETNTFRDDKDSKINLSTFNIMVDIAWEEYINRNEWVGCLCWFWEEDKNAISLGVLTSYTANSEKPFTKTYNSKVLGYKHCEPVKPEEIKFYGEE